MLDVGGWPSRGTSSMRTWWSSAVHTPPGSQLWCGKGLVVLARPCLGDEGVAGAGDLRDFWLQIVKKLLRSWAECQQHKARNLKLFGTEFCPEMFAPNSFADAMKSVGEDQVRRTHL